MRLRHNVFERDLDLEEKHHIIGFLIFSSSYLVSREASFVYLWNHIHTYPHMHTHIYLFNIAVR